MNVAKVLNISNAQIGNDVADMPSSIPNGALGYGSASGLVGSEASTRWSELEEPRYEI